MSLRKYVRDRITAYLEHQAERARTVEWEPRHADMVYGRNSLGDIFQLHLWTHPGPPAWRLNVYPMYRTCPDGRKRCTSHPRHGIWSGTDLDEGKAAAQAVSNEIHPPPWRPPTDDTETPTQKEFEMLKRWRS